jgi:adenosylcobinamide kinase/adenosylcobinamide-phosphate guanylyltransferase
MKQLILGGIRSGKSRLAEQNALATGKSVIYVATATAQDEEMRRRIARHRAGRPASWRIVEEPLQLADVLRRHDGAQHCIIVECLTLWLTNLLCGVETVRLEPEKHRLMQILPQLTADIIFVSNETNMGVVPVNDLARRYCDEAGVLHQQLAVLCDRVLLVSAGLPLVLKGEHT